MLAPVAPAHAQNQNSTTRLRCSEPRCIVGLVLDRVPETIAGTFKPGREIGKRPSTPVSEQIWNVLDQENSRTQNA